MLEWVMRNNFYNPEFLAILFDNAKIRVKPKIEPHRCDASLDVAKYLYDICIMVE